MERGHEVKNTQRVKVQFRGEHMKQVTNLLPHKVKTQIKITI
jgi:hypothetical protein